MNRRHPVVLPAAAIAVAFALGCVAPGSLGARRATIAEVDAAALPLTHLARIQQGPGAAVSSDGLHRVNTPDDNPGVLYVKAPRPRLYEFDSLVLAPVNIQYGKRTRRPRQAEELAIARHFRSSLAEELAGSSGWQVVPDPGDGVLKLEIAALGLELPDEALDESGATTTFVGPGGEVTIVMTLRNSLTGEPLLRFVERRVLPGGHYAAANTLGVERVNRAFDRFALDTRTNLETFHAAMREIRAAEGS